MVIDQDLKTEYPFSKNTYFVNNEIEMNFVDEGDGEPIVMLHGNPTWSFYYRNLIKEFSQTNRVVVPDHIGCGLSSKPQNYEYTLENHITNIENLIKKLELKNITLVVHDWGGAIGFGYATRHPENVKKIVILNTAAFTDAHIPWQINICRTPLIGERFIRMFNGFAGPATFMAVDKGLSKEVKRGYLFPYNNYKNRIATAKFVTDIPMNKNHRSYKTLKNIEDNLNKVTCPKLILWGKNDFCFTTHFYDRFNKIYPDAKSYLLDGGHYILEDQKDECIKKIGEFIQ